MQKENFIWLTIILGTEISNNIVYDHDRTVANGRRCRQERLNLSRRTRSQRECGALTIVSQELTREKFLNPSAGNVLQLA